MGKYTKYVNVFHGNGPIDLPNAEGIAATWHFIKALTGNTHPGAVLPFGKYSVCPYSGGYSSGYGMNKVNTGGKINMLGDTLRLRGFSHFHNSGTGAIGIYYNYAVVTPYYDNMKLDDYGVRNENGSPGYYSVTLDESNIGCELTVSGKVVYHRYCFDKAGGRIAIDFTNDGLYRTDSNLYSAPSFCDVRKLSDNELTAELVLQGIKLYFYVICEQGKLNNENEYEFELPMTADLKVGISAVSIDKARFSETQTFDEARIAADCIWNETLSRIDIESDNEAELEIFYSNMYHTLVKPCDWNGEGFLWNDAPFVVDFITLWDMYKTQLPLVFTLYPEISRNIVATYKKLGETIGILPHNFMLSSNFNIEAKQARMLAEYMLCDAYWRGIDGDWQTVLKIIEQDMRRKEYEDFFTNGTCEKTTHILDMADGCAAVMKIAREIGDTEFADKLSVYTDKWINAFDLSSGLMRSDSDYYEGNLWNYSFRPMQDMKKRIELCGSVEKFTEYLDRFFGYTHQDDKSTRFEGFNNETDMESPYAYHYVGQQDKLCEVIEAGNRYMFRTSDGGTGSGGIPGNNDSGGMTSCYIWNTLGIFPVSGQNLMLIGSPKFTTAELTLNNGNKFTIKRYGDSIYSSHALLNGKVIENFEFTVTDMINGGILEIYMK
jgi:Putative alpha-1,2-mannosidase